MVHSEYRDAKIKKTFPVWHVKNICKLNSNSEVEPMPRNVEKSTRIVNVNVRHAYIYLIEVYLME